MRNAQSNKKPRDVTRGYTIQQFFQKMLRFKKNMESGDVFIIQIAGERIRVPKHAVVSVEHERGEGQEEIEFQITWRT